MHDLTPAATTLALLQGLFVLGGLGLSGAWFFAPKLQPWRAQPARMPRWDAPLGDTLLVCWVAAVTVLFGSLLAGSTARQFGLTVTDGWTSVLSVIGFQGSLVLVFALLALYKRSVGRPLPAVAARPSAPFGDRILLGAAVFCVAMPFVLATSFASTAAMNALDLPIKLQDLAGLFATTNSPALLIALTIMGIVVAPLGEELLFRAGLFRLLGVFLPRWAAVLLSALAFATLHWSAVHFVPLTVLGIIFALAYEKSGSLLVPVIAHGLFNLNSILALLAGLGSTP
jgi:membrane protease YdiL (CAAX protease family)